MKRFEYTIILEPAEEGGYSVTVPALPGCFSQGDSREEALANAREAIECHIEALRDLKQNVPVETEKPEINTIEIDFAE